MPELGTLFEGGVLSLARKTRVRRVVESSPGSREVMSHFIAGQTAFQALSAARDLQATGRRVTIAHLGRETGDAGGDVVVDELRGLLDVAEATGRTRDGGLDLSVRPCQLGDIGAAPGTPQHARLLDRARRLTRAATNAGATLTLDMEGPDTVDATLALAAELRQDAPDVGVTVQAELSRSAEDCRTLAAQGARVRLCKGAHYAGRDSVGGRHAIDLEYVRCLKILMTGRGATLVATHDDRLVEIAAALAQAYRAQVEYQMYLGVRPLAQTALADRGEDVRVYVPYGADWYTYLAGRIAEKPSTTVGLTRSVLRITDLPILRRSR